MRTAHCTMERQRRVTSSCEEARRRQAQMQTVSSQLKHRVLRLARNKPPSLCDKLCLSTRPLLSDARGRGGRLGPWRALADRSEKGEYIAQISPKSELCDFKWANTQKKMCP